MFFFGGYTRKGGTYFNDLFQYKVQEGQWFEIRPNVAVPDISGMPASNRERQMYPDAGGELDGAMGTEESKKHDTVGMLPEARTDHTFVRYKNRFYVYGGRDEV